MADPGFVEEWYPRGLPARDSPQGKAVTMMPPVDAVTRDDLAYNNRGADARMRELLGQVAAT